MKITVIYGTEHKGSTYHIVQQVLKKFHTETDELHEFYLPRDFGEFCRSCGNCFMRGYEFCPHAQQLMPIRKALNTADFIIMASPVYVYHVSGQMKTFLDHFGWQWLPHRPVEAMFSKTALVVSTAAGAGMKSTNRDIKDSLDFWGVGHTITYGKAVNAINWESVPDKIKIEIEKDITKLCVRIRHAFAKKKPRLKIWLLFYVMRFMQKKFHFNRIDVDYWKARGWLEKKRPWN